MLNPSVRFGGCVGLCLFLSACTGLDGGSVDADMRADSIAGNYTFELRDSGEGPYFWVGDASDWQPVPMTRDGDRWWVEIEVSEPSDSGYKFVTASGRLFADLHAAYFRYDSRGEISLIAAERAYFLRMWVEDLGTIGARRVQVWVPEEDPTHHLYVQDGQNMFAPYPASGPFGSWHIDTSSGSNTLIVAIDNTADRFNEYTPAPDLAAGAHRGGLAYDYADFVAERVMPEIEARFGVPAVRGSLGSSLGGLAALVVAQKLDFEFAAGLSSTLGWGSIGLRATTLIDRAERGEISIPYIYVDSGGGPGQGCVDTDADGIADDGDGGDNYCETRQFANALAEAGYVWDDNLVHWWQPGAEHNEAAWGARVWRALVMFESIR